jgi:GNAT superfamily N-acetyltransferase
MLRVTEPAYSIRRAEKSEASLIAYLRFASLLCLEGQPLAASRTLMGVLPDVNAELIAGGRYLVVDNGGDLIAGAGWSVLSRRFRAERLRDVDGGPVELALDKNSVLLRGFFLDPDAGRRRAGAKLLDRVAADVAAAGYTCADIVAPHTAQTYYRSLGFKPVRKLNLILDGGELLPMLQMRRRLFLRLAAAA